MQIKTPDIGVDSAAVAEILVKVGDTIAENDGIVVLESDKASVEVPSTSAGVVKRILIKEGDDVTQGIALIELESEASEKSEPAPQKVVQEEVPEPKAQPQATTSQVVDVKVPDIGVEKASIGEILVKVGEQIDLEQSIVVVESDKATVEVPSSTAGVVESIAIKEGDTVQEGVVLITVKTATASNNTAPIANEKAPEPKVEQQQVKTSVPAGETELTVPDLGVDKAAVAEILVKVGDEVEIDDSILVVESDKATVEVPSTVKGKVTAIHLEVGQDVKQGMKVATVSVQGQAPSAPVAEKPQSAQTSAVSKQETTSPTAPIEPQPTGIDKLTKEQNAENANVYAGPAVRKLARELGVILAKVKSSGPHERVMKEDVFAYVKQRLNAPETAPKATPAPVASGLPPLPDFTAFGGVEEKPLTRLQQVSVPQLCLNNFIPQVTQFDQADITELEAWRNELKGDFKKQGLSLTILAFIAKALAHLLKEEPYFASHMSDDQKSVLLRKEIHMGIAVATPDGLTVPVLRNPDQKSITQIAIELGELSKKAREKKLSPKDLQGANFTITSLGSIGGTAFTPLVNFPQVAILGISPATMQPVWNGEGFDARLMLPLSLSYDHRVINGADAARFTNKLTKLLKDIRNLLI